MVRVPSPPPNARNGSGLDWFMAAVQPRYLCPRRGCQNIVEAAPEATHASIIARARNLQLMAVTLMPPPSTLSVKLTMAVTAPATILVSWTRGDNAASKSK
jgi:hypothetical protein